MGELRWILLAIGLALLVLVYLYTTRRRGGSAGDAGRVEPVIDAGDDTDEEAGGDGIDPGAEAEPAAEVSLDPEVVITVRLTARGRSGFSGDELVLALRKAGLRHGRFGIFHRHPDEAALEPPLFSVASLVEPGSFDLANLKNDRYPGVSFFLALPGPEDGVRAFDEMLAAAHELASGLQGELLDDQGSKLSVQRERYMREEVIRYQHRGAR